MQPATGLRAGWDGHVLLTYRSEQARGAVVAAWVQRGLAAGARIVYIQPRVASDTRRLSEVLTDNGVDERQALERGQLLVVDPDGVDLGPVWQTAVVDEGLRAGYPSVCVAGHAEACAQQMAAEAQQAAERSADALCRTRPVSVLCQYPADTDPDVLTGACALHGAGTRGERLQTVPLAGGVALIGEVDTANHRILRAVLAATCGSATEGSDGSRRRSPVSVDLRGLEFLDTGGARGLLTATAVHRGQGGVVRLHGARPSVDRLLRLLGVDRVQGIVLEDAA